MGKINTISKKTQQDTTETKKKETKKKTLDPSILKLVNDINKKYGDNAIMVGVKKSLEIKRIPTGSIALDIDLGGGVPIGRWINITGQFSSTKSTQCAHIIREAQNMGLVCAYIDVEGTTTLEYLESLNVDVETLIYCQPEGLEEATDIMLALQKSGQVNLAVWDSIEASTPTKERDSEMDESTQLGIKQKLIGEFCRKYQAFNNRLTRENNTPFTVIATNQEREKIGVMRGDPTYTPGGKAKDFTASVEIKLRRKDWITVGSGDNKEVIGQTVAYKIPKNKTYKRMQSGEFDFYYAENDFGVKEGFNDNIKSIIIAGVEWGAIERSGSYYYLDEDNKFQGKDKLVEYLREKPDKVNELKTKILDISRKFS